MANNKLIIFFVLLFFCATLTSAASNFASLFHSRITLTGKLISSTFQPQNSDYQQSLIVVALFGALMVVITIAWSVLFPLLRQYGCCGGAQPSNGCFRGSARKKLYPQWQHWVIRITVIVLAVLSIGITAVGIYGNFAFNDGFQDAHSSLRSTSDNLVGEAVNIQQAIKNLTLSYRNATIDPGLSNYLTNLDVQFDAIVENQRNFSSVTKTLLKFANRGNGVRFVFLFIVLIFAVIIPVVLCVATLGNWKFLTELVMSFGYYVVIIAWVCYTLHFVTAFAMADLCVAMDNYVTSYGAIANNTAATAQAEAQFLQAKGIIDLILNCQNSTFVPAFNDASSAVALNIKLLNEQLSSLSQQAGKPQTYAFNMTTLDQALLIDFVRNDTAVYKSVEQAINSIRALANIATSLTLASQCPQVYSGFKSAVDSACSSTLLAIDVMWAVFLAVALVQFAVVQCAFLAYKRFRKRKFVIPQKLKRGSGIVTGALLDDY